MDKRGLRETVKTLMQRLILPAVYRLSKKKSVTPGLVILADAHHDAMPYSMACLAERLSSCPEFTVVEIYKDYQAGPYLSIARSMLGFMRAYANAEYVVICDNHLPVASCRKRPETKVIQLWHSGGALKRFGYDSPDNIPKSYHGGNVYANYDLVPVSAEYAIEPYVRAMRIDRPRVLPLGVSRTDWFFDKERIEAARGRFAREYPDAAGKKVVLWAPTFRGSAGDPRTVGMDAIEWLRSTLPDDYYLIVKLHPHAQKRADATDSNMPAEQLLPSADILISDYSSVIYDYAFFGKPLVLFTPDYEEYAAGCGFYEDYDAIPAYRAATRGQLLGAVLSAGGDGAANSPEPSGNARADSADSIARISPAANPVPSPEAVHAFWRRTMSACDGRASDRVIAWMRRKAIK